MGTLTDSQILDKKAFQYKFMRHIPYVTTMLQDGATVMQCADEICRREGWCFITDKEMNFLIRLMEFIIL